MTEKHISDKAKVITGVELAEMPIPDVSYLVNGIIPNASLIDVYGPPGSFKTNLTLYIAMKCADGKNVFDFAVKKPYRILWIDEENRDRGMKDKFNKIANGIEFQHKDWKKNFFFTISVGYEIVDNSWTQWLTETVKKHKIDIVVLDSISKAFVLDERNEKEVKRIYTHFGYVIKNTGCSIIAIAHTRKLNQNQFSRGMEDLSGSREFAAMSDSMLLLEEVGHCKYKMTQTKNRYEEKCEKISFSVSNTPTSINVEYGGLSKDFIKKKFEVFGEKIMVWLIAEGRDTVMTKEVERFTKECGYTRDAMFKALEWLVEKNKLAHTVEGEYNVRK
jgi:RecA-family ATPase